MGASMFSDEEIHRLGLAICIVCQLTEHFRTEYPGIRDITSAKIFPRTKEEIREQRLLATIGYSMLVNGPAVL